MKAIRTTKEYIDIADDIIKDYLDCKEIYNNGNLSFEDFREYIINNDRIDTEPKVYVDFVNEKESKTKFWEMINEELDERRTPHDNSEII